MGAKQQQEKETFWGRYKFYVLGLVGSILLIASMSVQNVVLNYKVDENTSFGVKLDYSAFGLCLRCNGTNDEAQGIVEEDIFFCTTKEVSVKRAAAGIQKIAENNEGTFQVVTGGIFGLSDKKAQEIVDYLIEQGYKAEIFVKE